MTDKTGATPRKRPRQSRSAATYAAVLQAAAHILETRGLEAANTNLIAEIAGVSVGSLYQYFPDKTAIFAELIRSAERDAAQALESLARETIDLPFEVRLRLLIQAGVAQQMTKPRLARILDVLETEMPDDPELKASERRILQSIFEILRDSGEAFAACVDATTARDVLAIAKGMIDGASFAGETDAADLERRVERAVLGYLRQA
ncbi:MAG: TetR/AcrR family transcriptional regulator [Elsteraceae bacterium]